MVKANAYGHGADWTARQILAHCLNHSKSRGRLAGFGVATLDEGIALRHGLPKSAARLPVVVFSGVLPWNDDFGKACQQFGLTPVLSSLPDWKKFVRTGWAARLPFELKFNTGMNRLGLPLDATLSVKKDLQRLAGAGIFPKGVCSHLAMAENPEVAASKSQRRAFESLVHELKPVLPDAVDFHLANSAATLLSQDWRLEGLTQRVRPGLSLYGVAPEGMHSAKLVPVLTLEATVLTVLDLNPGAAVGYGGRYVADSRQRVAVLGAGYGDGVHRLWGTQNAGDSGAEVLLRGRPTRFAGTISMDLSAIQATKTTRAGERVRLFGAGIDPWKQARAAGTIPYEILTSLGSRVKRIYG